MIDMKVSSAKKGVRVKTDGGFDCIGANVARTLHRSKLGLYFKCREGRHYIDGQISDDGKRLIGLKLVDPPAR